MGKVYVKGKEWQALREKLQAVGRDVYVAQDTVVAKTAATARPIISSLEEGMFNFGQSQTKYRNGKKVTSKTKWNAKGGYWESSDKRRLIQFSFENTSSKYAKGKMRSSKNVISEAYLYSLTANLWDKDTKPYSMNSPSFWSSNKKGTAIWKKGEIRKGKNYFGTRAFGIVSRSVSKAIEKTEKQVFKEDL